MYNFSPDADSLKSSVLSPVPPELYDLILESLQNYLDCICFGLTCRFLWNVARRHVQKRYEEDTPGTWAGDRIVCATADTSRRANGLPAGLLTEAEETEWNTPLPTEGCGCGHTHPPNFLLPTFAGFALCHFKRHTRPTQVRPRIISRAAHDALRRGMGMDDFALLRTMLCMTSRPVLREVELVRPLVLRNLSRKLYVRREALDHLTKDNYEYRRNVGFVDVILLRATWSSAPISNPTAIRGPWAGDRFDFVSAKDFQLVEGTGDGEVVEWRDVSDEVVRDLKRG
ncbi:hypothetical protein EWM64_g5941 [Hericium alpestre]|uniref:F-box domain-containing protein n=1 Tax=Hericium alpestre TaxID=135208 RepID=A0A4Y9ZV85_9AGAM|nr:hypothetical protein EWM64_g5941 [Hericium alpestre]